MGQKNKRDDIVPSSSTQKLPTHSQVVIIGGGIIGCSVAYHLTKRGFSDVILLERKQLTCGTTWHAAGLVAQLRATQNLTRLAQYTTGLYENLEIETDLKCELTIHSYISLLLISTHTEK